MTMGFEHQRSGSGRAGDPLFVRAVRPAELEARRRLADLAACAACGFELSNLTASINGAEASIRSIRVSPAPAVLPADSVCLALSSADGTVPERFVLALPRRTALGIVDRALGRPGSAGLEALTSGEEGALLYAVDRAGGDWIAAGGARFVVRGVLADTEQVGDYLGQRPQWQVAAELAVDELQGPVWLWSPEPGGEAARASSPAVGDRARDWPVSLRVVVGRSALPGGELGGMAAGDVLVLDELGHPLAGRGQGTAQLVSGGLRLRAEWLDAGRLKLLSSVARRPGLGEETKDPRTVSARLVDPQGETCGSLEVVVQVELGRVSVSLERLLGLVAGGVLELDREAGPAVQLRVGDKLVATGDLVDCDGRLAVQIREVA
jgi:type III secretion system YscQ/HrcQ family protein